MHCHSAPAGRAAGLSLALTILLTTPGLRSQAPAVDHNVMVPMPDGVRLATDIYLPKRDGRFPVVLTRTPYDKRGKAWLAKALAARGYAVVLQDVRGQVASEGRFQPVLNERRDGVATLDWIVDQPWCDGRIGMWGTSYTAFCALILVPEQHRALKTIVNMSGFGDTPGFTYPGGALHLMLAAPWALSNQIRGKGSFADFDWGKLFRHVPVDEMPGSVGIANSAFQPMVQALDHPQLAEVGSIAGRLDRYRVPTLHVTGWNDFVSRETLSIYERVAARHPALTQHLLVGPWGHDQIFRDHAKVGGVDYGAAARMGIAKVTDLAIRWFDEHLRGVAAPARKPIRLFVMGSNRWREFEQWPPKAATTASWYLHSGGKANSRDGDGRLSTTPPAGASADRFVYDPLDPVPTTGGANFHFFHRNLGPLDQGEVEARADVLVYTGPACDQPFDIIGPVQAEVYAATAGRSMDVTAKLVLVGTDGVARIVTEGIRRATGMTPGRVRRFQVDLGHTALHVPTGARLRVQVSSSNFPKYTRNASTGERSEFAGKLEKAEQTVWHTPQYRSRIVFPVLRSATRRP